MEQVPASRRQMIMVITRWLLIFSGTTLAVAVSIFGVAIYADARIGGMSWLCFASGILGGFVSIQQRLKQITDEELQLLSNSRLMILVIPLFGGISALVLYILFLSGILESPLFPEFRLPEFVEGAGRENIRQFLTETYPVSGEDTAKLLFWSFVAGFSERFVPQIITRIVDDDKPKP